MNNKDKSVVIVGAGHGGVQLAASLREEGYQDRIILLGDEKDLPYQRPPLSKAFMKHATPEDGVILRGPDFYPQQGIELVLGERAIEIDRASRKLKLVSGSVLEYAKLALATGGIQRPLRIEGADLANVFSLRTMAEARVLRDCLDQAKNVVVIGAGFIGLEFAATAAAKGCKVDVVELASRPMARVVTEQTSNFFAAEHKKLGAHLDFETSVTALKGRDGKVTEAHLTDGRVLPADLVLIGIGLVPSQELAVAAGLESPDGIKVDDKQATADENIFVIGDAAYHYNPFGKRWMRLESVQNATDQARVLAKHLTGKPAHYESVPWFWSDQADLKLQMVGFLDEADKIVMRGSFEARAYSLFGFANGKLTGVESVNKTGDHMLARRLMDEKIPVSAELIADPNADLKALLRGARR
ncbi:MAG: FAD-dependent oxidoreductase [Methylovirgula sp.]|jgi:3-phenylpropionate/trans-cinnamate dioxygenase ferredoxin reductase subunit